MSSLILSEDDAKIVKRLEDAACEHGVVMDLLLAIEEWQSSGRPAPIDLRFFELAAMASQLARLERRKQGIDKDEE
jgi:hypothetical protein